MLGQHAVMLAPELRAPVDVDIGTVALGRADQDQLFFHQRLDVHAGRVLRLVDQRRIERARLQLGLQRLALPHFSAHRQRRHLLAHARGPQQHQRIAQADLRAEAEQAFQPGRQRQLAARRLPCLDQLAGIAQETLAVGGQAGAGLVALEQPAVQL
ncbi:hypothetical protein D3C81_1059100 [compost metagenome]